jgi:hypothetical protein
MTNQSNLQKHNKIDKLDHDQDRDKIVNSKRSLKIKEKSIRGIIHRKIENRLKLRCRKLVSLREDRG